LLPEVFIGPFAGALVDRWNRRRVMIIADGAIALVTFGLAALFFTGLVQTWHIFVVIFLRAIGGIFHWPAMQASTSLMVPEKHLARLSGINQGLRGALTIIAPPLGALLMSSFPMYGVIAVDVVTAMIAITPLLFVAIPQPAAAVSAEPISPRQLVKDVAEGLRYIRAWRGAFYLILIAMAINFFLSPSGTLLPLLVTKHFQGGVWELSLIESISGFGIVAGGILLGVWGGFQKRVYTTILGVIGIGLGVTLTGIAPAGAFAIGIAGWTLASFMNPITNGPLFAIMQARVAPEIQGRVFASINSLSAAMMPISMLVAGPVAEIFGIRTWFVVGGVVCAFLGILASLVPAIVNLESEKPPVAVQVAE
ncbi:MAG: MFS transporter, partial [Anaerolineaceae bacterium]|nr:MFS transporter [Anaerolineaceae bacterium]